MFGNLSAGLRSDLRFSPRPVLAALLLFGCVLFVGAELLLLAWPMVNRVSSLALCMAAASAVGWALFSVRPMLGRVFTVVVVPAIVYGASRWLDLPDVLVLAGISVVLAAALIGAAAAAMTAVGETLALILLAISPAAQVEVGAAAVASIGIWSALGLLFGIYQPIHHVSDWLEKSLEHAQRLLQDARDSRVELGQTMESLANANRQLALANERSAGLRAVAEDAERAKTAFVANVSHEFRTPLNMIIGLVDLMMNSPGIYDVVLSPKMQDDLAVVHRNCVHISKMIDDVLDLTRMEAGRMILHQERVDLAELVERSAVMVRPLLEKKRIWLETSIPVDFPPVYCDRVRIQQVLLNLLSNSARFTEQGGILVRVMREANCVELSVTDSGSGISPEDVERIFEPFSQGAGQLWRDKGGSGLGLSVSRQFVRLHGGRMWLESELGIGTTFHFTLPISPPIERTAKAGHVIREDWIWREGAFRSGSAGAPRTLGNPRIVLYDKTGGVESWLTRYADDLEVVAVQSTDQVSSVLGEWPTSAVLLNTDSREQSLSLAEQIGEIAPLVPVISCSVRRSTQRALDAGALDHLIKPVTRDSLEDLLVGISSPIHRILVVDDDPDILSLFSRMLKVIDEALEVVAASTGAQALNLMHRDPPDLVLLDIGMPDMDGWQILKRMKRDERTRDIPTVFVSAQDTADRSPTSSFVHVSIRGGVPTKTLLQCLLEFPRLLSGAKQQPDPAR